LHRASLIALPVPIASCTHCINVRARLLARVSSRNPQKQMPPLGTRHIDVEALAMLERWISQKSSTAEESKP
jgi:hypothetical protein